MVNEMRADVMLLFWKTTCKIMKNTVQIESVHRHKTD